MTFALPGVSALVIALVWDDDRILSQPQKSAHCALHMFFCGGKETQETELQRTRTCTPAITRGHFAFMLQHFSLATTWNMAKRITLLTISCSRSAGIFLSYFVVNVHEAASRFILFSTLLVQSLVKHLPEVLLIELGDGI